MSTDWSPQRNRLGGKHVVVLAAIPDADGPPSRFPRDGAPLLPSSGTLETEEAVMSLVRAIVGDGGRVTVIAASPLAFLASVVAGEFVTPQLQETHDRPKTAVSVVITDAEAIDESFEHLSSIGYVSVTVGSKRSALLETGRFADALVCAGDGSVDDVAAFRQANDSGAQVFALVATGGASARLAESPADVIVADLRVEREAPLPRTDAGGDDVEREPEAAPLPAVALTAQWIVEQLIERS